MINGTYATLASQIADELGDRTDLLQPLSDSGLSLSPVQNAIQSAISKWEREPFYFNEYYAVAFMNTVSHQEFYGVADNPAFPLLPRIRQLRITVNNNRYTLYPRTWQYLEDISVNPAVVTSIPVDWAYYAEMIRLYPIPNASYPLTFNANQRLLALVNPNDANAWTEDGYDLIRATAKLILAQEVLHDAALAAECTLALYGSPQVPGSRGYWYDLKSESSRRSGQGRIRPTFF